MLDFVDEILTFLLLQELFKPVKIPFFEMIIRTFDNFINNVKYEVYIYDHRYLIGAAYVVPLPPTSAFYRCFVLFHWASHCRKCRACRRLKER